MEAQYIYACMVASYGACCDFCEGSPGALFAWLDTGRMYEDMHHVFSRFLLDLFGNRALKWGAFLT
jgi:hypothetical protein